MVWPSLNAGLDPPIIDLKDLIPITATKARFDLFDAFDLFDTYNLKDIKEIFEIPNPGAHSNAIC